jgi:hypothetical protein
LIKYLKENNYFTIPANRVQYQIYGYMRTHPLNCPNGLLIQNWLVYNEFKERNNRLGLKFPHDSIVICSFLHSLWKLKKCQVNIYGAFLPSKDDDIDDIYDSKAIQSLFIAKMLVHVRPEESEVIKHYQGTFGASDTDKYIDIIRKKPIAKVFSSVVQDVFEHSKGPNDFVNEKLGKIEKDMQHWI